MDDDPHGAMTAARLLLLTALTMVAFAANSLLNRAGVEYGGTDPITFATVRLWAGAITLVLLVLWFKRFMGGPGRAIGVASLLVYIFGFSWAYLSLDAGVGALILFGTVQITMFAAAFRDAGGVPPRRLFGAALAFGGLVWLLWPGAGVTISLTHAGAMIAAGVGWGFYSLVGRRATDPLGATAANFAIAAPIGLVVFLLLPTTGDPAPLGIGLAIVAGALTSGLGYALWYSVVPTLGASRAAVAQLTVPVIALLAGALLLSEPLSGRIIAAAAIVLIGVALA